MNQEKENNVTAMASGKTPPWNEWLRLARQGDENAKLRFCAQAEPFVKNLCNTRYFRDWLGAEEIREIATIHLIEFMMAYDKPPDDERLPYLLKRILHNQILKFVERKQSRNCRELRVIEDNADDREKDAMEIFPTNRKEEPEAKLLEKELHRVTAEALGHLKPGEQAMIRAFFFQNKTTAAIAKELQCSRQYVEKVKNKALERLHRLLEGYAGLDGGALCQ